MLRVHDNNNTVKSDSNNPLFPSHAPRPENNIKKMWRLINPESREPTSPPLTIPQSIVK